MNTVEQFLHHFEFNENKLYDWYIIYRGRKSGIEFVVEYVPNMNEANIVYYIRHISSALAYEEDIIIELLHRSKYSESIFQTFFSIAGTHDNKITTLIYNGKDYSLRIR